MGAPFARRVPLADDGDLPALSDDELVAGLGGENAFGASAGVDAEAETGAGADAETGGDDR